MSTERAHDVHVPGAPSAPPLTLVPPALPPRIGPYDVTRELGRGGMGVVYHARDPRLNRSVAIKAVTESFARDPERLARFEREGRLLASLDHPNVAGIHGVEECDGRRYLVLEYVDGETLAERLARGPMRLDEALDVCRQIATALEAAHEHGVVHRDLKPGNVKIKSDGQVKVLDFGLAKEHVGSSGAQVDTPTVTFAATSPGMILGTAAYMSPEQARGREVDRRTDVWAFGCLLYECLTGRQAFAGETLSDTLARILERDPAWESLPSAVPGRVRQLLRRCLVKDVRRRMRDMGDVRLELEEAIERPAGSSGSGAWLDVTPGGRARRWARTGLVLALAAVTGGAVWAVTAGRARRPTVSRWSVSIPAALHVASVTPTPDGTRLVFVARAAAATPGEEALTRLYVRPRDGFELTAIPGTEGITSSMPAIAGDSRWAYYVATTTPQSSQRRLYRVALDGGSPPLAICDWRDGWCDPSVLGNGDLLVLTDVGTRYFTLPPRGGETPTPRPVTFEGITGSLEIPGNLSAVGRHGVLLNLLSYGPRGWLVCVTALDVTTGRAHVVVEDGGYAVLTPAGELLFSRADALLAAHFDRAHMRLVGEPVAVGDGMRTAGAYLPASFTAARDGTLLFAPGGRAGEQRQMVVLDSPETAHPLTADHQSFLGVVAPARDGRRVAMVATNTRGLDEIWVHDAGQPALRRVVSLPADCDNPVWAPDSRHLAFTRMANDDRDGIYVTDVDGNATPQRVMPLSNSNRNMPWSWSKDGATLLIQHVTGGTSDLWMLPFDAAFQPGTPRALLATPAMEMHPALSPDGRWLAYTSDVSGRSEVYVRRWLGGGALGAPFQVTPDRALYPRWMGDGRLVYYDDVRESGMVVRLGLDQDPIAVGTPALLVRHRALRAMGFGVWPDGRVVAIQRSPEEDDASHYDVVLHGMDEAHARLRAGH